MLPKHYKILNLLVCLILLAFLPSTHAFADTGPKPTMDFQFHQEMTEELPLTITSGILYECDQHDCSDAAPLEEVGPQRFTCELNSCRATAYGFAHYHTIEIQFSDGKTRRSDVFETAGFNSQYIVTIRPDELVVDARFSLGFLPRIATILIACICALVGIGLLAGGAYFLARRFKKI